MVSKTSGGIYGKPVVAACNGVVRIVDNASGCGNYISITTDFVDPITGNNLVIVYMHLSELPTYKRGDSVLKGDVIGYAGNTGYERMGAHLHFDVNNENKNYSNSKNGAAFKYSINPIFFFPATQIILQDCTSDHDIYWPGI